MRIGLTYDLKQEYLEQGYTPEETAEFDSVETLEAIEQALQALCHETERIGNAQALARALALGQRWDMVFNIAEGLYGIGREALVPAMLDAWRIPCVFSDPMVMSLCLHKGMAKRVVRDLGLPTPEFAVIEDIEALHALDVTRLGFPLFAKPVAEGTGKGVTLASRCDDPRTLEKTCRALLERFRQPVIVERYLPGREFTVGIAGTGRDATVLGVMEILLLRDTEGGAYGYGTKGDYENLVEYRPVNDQQAREAARVALEAYRGLGIRDAGRLDLRAAEDGVPHFIEANPLAGLHPVHSDLPIICRQQGTPYKELVAMIVRSAMARESLAGVSKKKAVAMAC